MDVLVVGIAGGTGSGKSTVTNRLSETFGDRISVIRHDDYYKEHHSLTYEERTKLNYDCPDAYDTQLLCEHIEKLKRGESVNCPVYDFSIHDRSSEVCRISPSSVIIIDGILILQDKRLREITDIKVFVDTDADERILRRIKRDFSERARSLDSVISQYLDTVKPMHEKYVEPSRKYADIIIPNGGYNPVAIDLLETKLRVHLDKSDRK